MSGGGEGRGRAALTQKTAEIGMAAVFLVAGGVVIYDSLRLGAKWADDGPQAGYLPFYIGLIMCLAALVNLVRAALVAPSRGKAFVQVDQLKLVLAVLVPTAIYAGLIAWLGIYLASILFIGYFMRWLGHYAWWKLIGVAVGNSAFFFVVFEFWFKIPLPKGPLETLLGLN